MKQELIDNKVKEIEEYLESHIVYQINTCDASNWDVELHYLMPDIVTRLRNSGYRVGSNVKYSVTEWTIISK